MSVPYALSSGTSANALWQDNGGYISPANYNGVIIDNNLDVNGYANFSYDVYMNGFITAISGVILDVMSNAEFWNDVNMWSDVEMNGFMTRIQGAIFEVYSNSEFYGPSNFYGDVRRYSPEVNPEDLTSKGYVDGADAAIMDSITALDSTMTANALWQDNGGWISPANYNGVMIDNHLDVMSHSSFNGDVYMNGFITAISGVILDVMSNAEFWNDVNMWSDVEMNGFMTIFAQTVPQGINYQAVARDASGATLVNQTLGIQLSIIAGSGSGSIVWQEQHNVTTNNYGLFTTTIGQGISTGIGSQPSFADIDWGAASHFTKVELDLGSGCV
jgi:hypothetical protein